MNKKVFYIILLILVFAVSSYLYFSYTSPDEPAEQPETEEESEDRLAEIEQESIEENINAFDITDDIRLTEDFEQENDNEDISTLNQKQVKYHPW